MNDERQQDSHRLPDSAVGAIAMGYVIALFFADYISSWLPSVAGFPTGAIIRDGLATLLVSLAAFALVSRPWLSQDTPAVVRAAVRVSVIAGVIGGVWLSLLVVLSDHRLAALLSVRNLALYFLAAGALWILFVRGRLAMHAVSSTVWVVVLVAATLGILDTLTHGSVVSALGYSREYAGETRATLVAGAEASILGFVRASGGISNALVFGYSMAAATLTAAWFFARRQSGDPIRPWMIVVAVVAATACVSSLTRGASIALLAGAVVLLVFERRREMVVAVAGVVLGAVIASVAIPVIAQRDTETDVGSQATDPGTYDPNMPPMLVRLSGVDESSEVSSEMRLKQLREGVAVLIGNPFGVGLASVGSASLRVDAPPPLVTDFYFLMVALQVGFGLSILLGVAVVAAVFALWFQSREITAPLLAISVVFVISGILSAAPDAPVFVGLASVLVVIAASAKRVGAQSIAFDTAERNVLRRSLGGT